MVDADDESESSDVGGLNSGAGVFDDDHLDKVQTQPPGGLEEHCGVRFARQPQSQGIGVIDGEHFGDAGRVEHGGSQGESDWSTKWAWLSRKPSANSRRGAAIATR